METKQNCTNCKEELLLSFFHKNSKLPSGHYYVCKKCRKLKSEKNKEKLSAYHKKNYKKNSEKIKKRSQDRRLKNPEQTKIYFKKYRVKNLETLALYKKEYYEKNKAKIFQKIKQRSKEDIVFRLKSQLRSRLRKALKRNSKKGSAVEDLGCSIVSLKNYLQNKFKPGMSWDNWSLKGWHIDHIVPLSAFDLTVEEELKKACHYTNLQPLWAKDNHSKGGVRGKKK